MASETGDPRRTGALRLPLQVGLAGLGQTTRYAALLWLGPLLLLASAALAPAFATALRLLWVLCSGLGSIVVMAFTLEAADRAKRDRPSDLLLDEQGLVIVGLGKVERRLGWSALDPARCELVAAEPRLALRWLLLSWLTLRRVPALVARAQVPVFRLRVPLGAGGEVLLAEAEGEERASLEALRDSIRSAYEPTTDDAPRELAPEILRCSNCGAPQVPVDRDAAPCPFCGQELAMPEALREKLHALGELRQSDAKSTRLIARLLSQPSALAANRWLWLGRKLLVWIQPAAVVYLCLLLYHQTEASPHPDGIVVARLAPNDDALFFYDLGVFALALVLVFWIVWSALSAYFANRKALRVLAESFGAVPPAKPGAPSTCRQCGAPLPNEVNSLLVRCAYCSAQNVFGVDPRPAAARKRRASADLDQAVRGRRTARIRLALTLPVCALFAFMIAREAVVLWWIPKADPNARDAIWHTHVGVVQNLDGVRRSLAFKDGTSVVHATILPHGSLFWDCPSSCTIERGAASLSADGLVRNATLVISGGKLSSGVGAAP